jgi:glucose-6-phosphate isomerase
MSEFLNKVNLSPLRFDESYSRLSIHLAQYEKQIFWAKEQLASSLASGTGWMKDPLQQNARQLLIIDELAQEIKNRANVLIVVGVGGSYIGAKAIQQALSTESMNGKSDIEVLYIGHHLSGHAMKQLLQKIKHRNVYLNVISKSGKTLETALAFRILRQWMHEKYGEDYQSRIIVTTDERNSHYLQQLADEQIRALTIPTTIGGRFSVFTAVGLLPLAVAGVDIQALLTGARDAAFHFDEQPLIQNAADRYAITRYELYKAGYQMELLAVFEPCLADLQHWWQQLFAESEGKNERGLFPSAVRYSTDLHSVGQFIQQGSPILFETILHVKQLNEDCMIPPCNKIEDGYDYLEYSSLNEVNAQTMDGVIAAHMEANVPIVQLEIEKLDEYHIGYLCYFFMKACAISACLLEVNPFDQPGVECYKQKTIARLLANSLHKIY